MSDFLNSLFLTRDDKLIIGSELNKISKIVYDTEITSKEDFDFPRCFRGITKEVQMKDLGIQYFLDYEDGKLLPEYFKQIYHLSNPDNYSLYYIKLIDTIKCFNNAITMHTYKNLCDDISGIFDLKIDQIKRNTTDESIIPKRIPKSTETQLYLFNGICVNVIKINETEEGTGNTLYSANAINWTNGYIHKEMVKRGTQKEIFDFINNLIFYQPKQ